MSSRTFKILMSIPSLLLMLSACSPKSETPTNLSPEQLEKVEEVNNKISPHAALPVIIPDSETRSLIGRKQGKIEARIRSLGANDRQLYSDYASRFDTGTVTLNKAPAGTLSVALGLARGDGDKNRTRDFSFDLIPTSSETFEGQMPGSSLRLTATCAKAANSPECGPESGWVIEVKDLNYPFGGKPIDVAYYYRSASISISYTENNKNQLGILTEPTLTSIVRLNDGETKTEVAILSSTGMDLRFVQKPGSKEKLASFEFVSSSQDLVWFRENGDRVASKNSLEIGVYDGAIGNPFYQADFTFSFPVVLDYL